MGSRSRSLVEAPPGVITQILGRMLKKSASIVLASLDSLFEHPVYGNYSVKNSSRLAEPLVCFLYRGDPRCE